jgi:hypothetical protein
MRENFPTKAKLEFADGQENKFGVRERQQQQESKRERELEAGQTRGTILR